MAPSGVRSDSFDRFDELYGFLYRSLQQVLEICGEDIIILKHTLGQYILSQKGEIRKNCQAHTKQKDIDLYLRSIKSKLKVDLLDQLLGKEVNSEYESIAMYPTTDRTPIEEEFICEIRESFKSLFKYIDDLLPKEGGKPPAPAQNAKKYRTASHPPSYTLNPSVDKAKFIELFHLLKGKFISDETTVEQFMACFSGNPVSTKVKWKFQNALSYFIRQLDQKELIAKIPNGKWKTASECFANKNGELLDSENLGKNYPPISKKSKEIFDAIPSVKKFT
jgi:hypothetical protein